MGSLVRSQVAQLSEALLTLCAVVWFFPRVDVLVDFQMRLLHEGFSTLGTGVWFLSRVHPHVDPEVGRRRGPLPALPLLPGVRPGVDFEVAGPCGNSWGTGSRRAACRLYESCGASSAPRAV